MEDKKCCMGTKCEHKEGVCCGGKCCMNRGVIKVIIFLIVLVLVFYSGISIGKRININREGNLSNFSENNLNNNIKQETASGSVTVDVLPPEKNIDTKNPPVLE